MKKMVLAGAMALGLSAVPANATVIKVSGAGTLTFHHMEAVPGSGPGIDEVINSPITFQLLYDTEGGNIPGYFGVTATSMATSPAFPSASTGALSIATLAFSSTATQYAIDALAGNISTGYDLRFNALVAGAVTPGQGAISVLPGSTVAFQYRLNTFSGTLTSLVSEVAAVPEPASWAMMLVGLGAIGAALRMSKRRVRFNGLAAA
jgi:hypothetical protein